MSLRNIYIINPLYDSVLPFEDKLHCHAILIFINYIFNQYLPKSKIITVAFIIVAFRNKLFPYILLSHIFN